ncbi:RIP metalloprotease RseP [Clostridia bacterium]|nr:RIP metalloprotease RseP [Clostridia bacterium]
MTFLLTFIVIGIIATVHELGHFFVARMQGIPVKELSLGIGPKIMQKQGEHTMFSLRIIPIFAYVNLAGETSEEQNIENGYLNAKPGAKAKVLVAGSAMNIVLAIVIFMIIFMGMGVLSDEPIIGSISMDSPAEEAGLLEDDRILSINGENVESWDEISEIITSVEPVEIDLILERDGENIETQLTPYEDLETGRLMIGIGRPIVKLNPFQAIYRGIVESYTFIVLMVQALFMMVTGAMPAELSGPVGIATMVKDASDAGLLSLMYFTAILSLNLAIINMLPIPGLDGGKLILVLIEKIRGKRLPVEKEALINMVGFFLIIAIMVFATYNDVLKLFGN